MTGHDRFDENLISALNALGARHDWMANRYDFDHPIPAGFGQYHLRFMYDAPKDFPAHGTAGFWQHPAAPDGEEILFSMGGKIERYGRPSIILDAPAILLGSRRGMLAPSTLVAFFPKTADREVAAEVWWAKSAAPAGGCNRTNFRRVLYHWAFDQPSFFGLVGWMSDQQLRRKVELFLNDQLEKLARFCAAVNPDSFPFSHHRGLAELLAQSREQLGEMYLR